jgi:chromate transporter
VGVILNLAAWFAVHVMFADVHEVWVGPVRLIVPDPATLDPWALALAAAAMVAMLIFRIGLLATIAGAGVLGILLRLW